MHSWKYGTQQALVVVKSRRQGEAPQGRDDRSGVKALDLRQQEDPRRHDIESGDERERYGRSTPLLGRKGCGRIRAPPEPPQWRGRHRPEGGCPRISGAATLVAKIDRARRWTGRGRLFDALIRTAGAGSMSAPPKPGRSERDANRFGLRHESGHARPGVSRSPGLLLCLNLASQR